MSLIMFSLFMSAILTLVAVERFPFGWADQALRESFILASHVLPTPIFGKRKLCRERLSL